MRKGIRGIDSAPVPNLQRFGFSSRMPSPSSKPRMPPRRTVPPPLLDSLPSTPCPISCLSLPPHLPINLNANLNPHHHHHPPHHQTQIPPRSRTAHLKPSQNPVPPTLQPPARNPNPRAYALQPPPNYSIPPLQSQSQFIPSPPLSCLPPSRIRRPEGRCSRSASLPRALSSQSALLYEAFAFRPAHLFVRSAVSAQLGRASQPARSARLPADLLYTYSYLS